MFTISNINELLKTNFKHISFDIWMTLLRSNPEFLYHRTILTRDYFEINQPLEVIAKTINEINQNYNLQNELSETHTHFEIILNQIIGTLKNKNIDIESSLNSTFYKEWELLFLHYPPLFLDTETPKIIESLASEGKTISLLSNTTLIKGRSLHNYFENIGIANFINFEIYSDECLHYKPSPKIFEQLISKVPQIQTQQIAHTGDSFIADYLGAQRANITGILFQPF
ncbi:HAD family hydrolase [Flavobacterium oreochromis]|uniref:HAD family hydrolase n=1 Tax=Flavobacterium oreochromis TaxID=2906078 RepID=A0ABW8PCC7_9FLAO